MKSFKTLYRNGTPQPDEQCLMVQRPGVSTGCVDSGTGTLHVSLLSTALKNATIYSCKHPIPMYQRLEGNFLSTSTRIQSPSVGKHSGTSVLVESCEYESSYLKLWTSKLEFVRSNDHDHQNLWGSYWSSSITALYQQHPGLGQLATILIIRDRHLAGYYFFLLPMHGALYNVCC